MARRRTWWSNAALRQSIALTDGGGPAWASGAHLWKDFAANLGNMSSPADTHAATIYAPNAAGVYLPFAANELVRTDLGLQVVPTRTNSIRNNSNTGASAPSTLPTNWAKVNGTGLTLTYAYGTAGGLPYIDVAVSGTSGDANGTDIRFEANSVIAALNAQVWSLSASIALIAGSFTNVNTIKYAVSQRDAGGAALTTVSGSDIKGSITTELSRLSSALTLNNASTAFIIPSISIGASSGVALSFTLRIGAVQTELGAFASPPILTTSAAATVTGNLPIVSGLSTQLAVGVAGFVQYDEKAANASLNRIIEISDGTTSNLLVSLRSASTTSLVEILVGGVSQGAVAATKPAEPAGITTVAFAFTSNFYSERFVGQAQGAVDAVSTYPTGLDRIGFLNRVAATTQNSYGFIRKVALKFGPQDQASFDAMYAKAVLAAAA